MVVLTPLTCSKKSKSSSREGLRKDIYNLIFCRDVTNLKVSFCHFLSHKMIINFNMFCPSIKHRINSQVCRAYVITPQKRRLFDENSKLKKERLKPCDFSRCVSYGLEFSFGRRSSNCALLFGWPGDKVMPHVNCITSSGALIINISSPVGVCKGL